MKLLLDTHAFIWWTNEPEKLSGKAQALLNDDDNELILSVASIWEMQIKLQLGKLRFTVPLGELIESQEQKNGVRVLSVVTEHVLALDGLPPYHKTRLIDCWWRRLAWKAHPSSAVTPRFQVIL